MMPGPSGFRVGANSSIGDTPARTGRPFALLGPRGEPSDRIDIFSTEQVLRVASTDMSTRILIAAGLACAMVPLAASAAGSAEAGKTKNSMCIGCHAIPGYKASFPGVYQVPMIK